MKKAVFVLPHMGLGGVERSFLGLLRYAPKQDWDITLLLLSPGGELLNEVPEWVHVRCPSSGGAAERFRAGISGALKKLKTRRVFSFAKSVYHKFGPKLQHRADSETFDVAVAYSDGLATWYVASAIRAAKKIAFVHTDFLQAGYNAQSERPVYQGYDSIYFGSAQSRARFLELLPGLSAKTEVLPNCIDREHIRLLAQEPCEALDMEGVSLMTVSRLSPEKGLEKIPMLLNMLQADGVHVHWYVVGGGSEGERLKAEAARLGVERHLTLLGPKNNPYPYMAQCDVYVQPSNYEGYCIALAEARALGLPCVACAFSGAEEQIRNGVTGFVTGMEASELYKGLKPLVESKERRSMFRRNLEIEGHRDQSEIFSRWWQGL